MKYFISSRWRNKDRVLELTEKLRAKNQEVFCFFEFPTNIESTDDDPEKKMEEFESMIDWKKSKKVEKVFEYAVSRIKEADALILLLPAGRSAHIESGIAYGLGKKCIVVGPVKKPESMYLIFSEFYKSIDDFIKSI